MSELADFFLKLEKQNWSGEIQVTASEGHAFVIIEDGRFVYAYRPIDRAAERLSKLEWLSLPPETIIQSSKTWEEFVRHVLTQNIQAADRFKSYLKTDRLELFFRTFFWTNVELTPRPFEMEISDNQVLSFYTKRDLNKLVQEGMTRIKEWPIIQKKIGSSRRIFVSRVAREIRSRRGSHDAIDSAILNFEGQSNISGPDSFTDEQSNLLALCNGSNSVQEIVRLSADGEFLTLRRLIDLWDKGLIAPKEEEPFIQVSEIRLLPGFNDWKAAIALSILLAFTLFFLKAATLQERPQPVPEALLRGLEIYRAEQGRYPVTLAELEAAGLISGVELNKLEYKLLNLGEYSIWSKI